MKKIEIKTNGNIFQNRRALKLTGIGIWILGSVACASGQTKAQSDLDGFIISEQSKQIDELNTRMGQMQSDILLLMNAYQVQGAMLKLNGIEESGESK